MNEVSLEQLSAGRFAELAQTKFQVLVEPGLTISLELISVTSSCPRGQEQVSAGSPTLEGFSLLLNGPAAWPLGQRTYRFTHERLGAFDLFIVPVGADHQALQYEAVFNRRLAPGRAAGGGSV